MNCGKPSHIRKWFGPCALSYGHGGLCDHPPLAALHESDGRCDTCGNDRDAWDRAIAEIARLTALRCDCDEEAPGGHAPTCVIAVRETVAAMEREVGRLRAALQPFAEFGAVVGGNARDHVCGMYVAVGKRRDLHVSDFRAAAKALAPEGGPGGGRWREWGRVGRSARRGPLPEGRPEGGGAAPGPVPPEDDL